MFQDDEKNMTFHMNFVHKTLNTLKKLKPSEIVMATSGYSFWIYCILVFLILISLFACCCCPTVLIGVIKCTISNVMQFLTYLIALAFEGVNFVYRASVTAYQSRRENENDMLDNNVSENQLSPNLTKTQVPCDPTTSICPSAERPV